MTKAAYIDGVHLLVTGGEITDENSVWREDIEALLPAAVNVGVMMGFFDQANGENDRDIPNSFVGTFENVPIVRTDPVPYFLLPKTVLPLPSDRGIRMVRTPSCENTYTLMNDNMFSSWSYYKKVIQERMFKPEGKKCLLFNVPPLEANATVRMLVSTEDYADDEHLPVPAGREFAVIEALRDLFLNQRNTPTDKIIDKTDIN